MAGMIVGGYDVSGHFYAVETVTLELTPQPGRVTVGNRPNHGDGDYLLLRHNGGMVEWCRSVDDLPAFGIDLATGVVLRRWE